MSRRPRLAALALAAALAGCGHSYDPIPVAPALLGLGLVLTRVGPNAVQLDWDADPRAVVYRVSRDGFPIADVGALSVVDAALPIGGRYCWSVLGLAPSGQVLSQTSVGCLTVF